MANASTARLCALVVAVVAACGQQPAPVTVESSGPTATTAEGLTTPASTTAAPPGPRTVPWVDLVVGDCVATVPAVDLGEVAVTIVDCAAPHGAEVYLLTDIPVNTALTDVADAQCRAGLPAHAADASGYSVTYLIDSRQDRTSNNPLPSTVICLLQASDGTPLTGSARA